MKHRRVICSTLTGLFVSLLVCMPMSAQAKPPSLQSGPPFQFLRPQEFKFTLEEIGKIGVQVVNNTATQQTLNVTLDPQEFQSLDGEKKSNIKAFRPVGTQDGLAKLQLEGGKVVQIKFELEEHGDPPNPGTYTGLLHVWDESFDFAIHLPVTLEVPAAKAKGAAIATGESPVPLVDEWKVQYYRLVPYSPLINLQLFWPRRNTLLPLDIDANKGQAIALDPIEPLGYLTNPGYDLATAKWTPPTVVMPGTAKLAIRLKITNIGHTGDYIGKIDLLPDDDKNGEVTLTTNVTDIICWPIVAILIGIAAAWAGKMLLGVNRNIWDLYQDEADTLDLKKEQDCPDYNGYKIVNFDWQRKLILNNIRALKSTHRWYRFETLDAENEAYKSIVESLKKLDGQVTGWNAFCSELKALKAALSLITATRTRENNPEPRPPQFKIVAEELTKGISLKFADLDLVVEQGEEYTGEEAKEFFDVRREKVIKATQLAQSWSGWVQRLDSAKNELQSDDAQQAALELPEIAKDARFELARVQTLLWVAPDLGALETYEMEKALRKAEGLVYGLIAYKTVPPPERTAEWQPKAEDRGFIKGVITAIQEFVPYSLLSKLPEAPEERRLVVQRALQRSDGLMIILAVIAGLYLGLTDLYFGKIFGTPVDYLKAFAWGFGAKATLELIYAAVGRMVRVSD